MILFLKTVFVYASFDRKVGGYYTKYEYGPFYHPCAEWVNVMEADSVGMSVHNPNVRWDEYELAIVFSHSDSAGSADFIRNKNPKIKIVTLPEFPPSWHTQKENWGFAVRMRRDFDASDLIITGQEMVRDEVVKFFGLPEDKVKWVPLPINIPEYKKFTNLEERKKILAMSCHCLLGDSYVNITSFPTKIKDISIGENILSENGEPDTVKHIFHRVYTGALLQIKGTGILPFKITPDHSIKVARVKWFKKKPHTSERRILETCWKPAKLLHPYPETSKLEIYDYLCVPKLQRSSNIKFSIKGTNVILDTDFAWLLGIYLAEGWATNGTIGFVLNRNEITICEKIITILHKFGIKSKYRIDEKNNGLRIHTYSPALAHYLTTYVGKKAYNKHIPEEIFFNNNDDIVKSFIQGYFQGDGYFIKNAFVMDTSSVALAIQLQSLFTSFGVFIPIIEVKRTGDIIIKGIKVKTYHNIYRLRTILDDRASQVLNSKKSYINSHKVYLEDREIFYIPISKIKTIECLSEEVWNLETQNTNTYLVNNVVIHNCNYLESGLRSWRVVSESKEKFIALKDYRTRVFYGIKEQWVSIGKPDEILGFVWDNKVHLKRANECHIIVDDNICPASGHMCLELACMGIPSVGSNDYIAHLFPSLYMAHSYSVERTAEQVHTLCNSVSRLAGDVDFYKQMVEEGDRNLYIVYSYDSCKKKLMEYLR